MSEDPAGPVTHRDSEWFVAALAAIGGAAFLYWSVRGLSSFGNGARDSAADPFNAMFGLIAAAWMLLMAVRLARGPKIGHLFSGPELLLASLVSLGGGIWFLTLGFALPKGLFLPAIGALGLLLWWRRR